MCAVSDTVFARVRDWGSCGIITLNCAPHSEPENKNAKKNVLYFTLEKQKIKDGAAVPKEETPVERREYMLKYGDLCRGKTSKVTKQIIEKTDSASPDTSYSCTINVWTNCTWRGSCFVAWSWRVMTSSIAWRHLWRHSWPQLCIYHSFILRSHKNSRTNWSAIIMISIPPWWSDRQRWRWRTWNQTYFFFMTFCQKGKYSSSKIRPHQE